MDMNPKKVLIFSTAYVPFIGGAEIAVQELTRRLQGFEFDLITAKLRSDLPKSERVGGVTVYRIGVGMPIIDKLLLPFLGALKAARLHKSRKYTYMWGIMATYASGAGYVWNVFRQAIGKRKIPMILTLQEGVSEEHLTYKWGGLLALSWKLALRNTDRLTAISTYLLKRAEKNGFKGKSFLIPNGVDVSLFTKENTEEVAHIKNILQKKDSDVYLVTTSRLTHKNGVDTVMEALPLLPEYVSFVVLGVGEDENALRNLARKLNVESRVKFVGLVSYPEIPAYLKASDIFIRASRSEGFGNSFIEAMAAEVPVIATPVGGIVDFLEDRKTGVFCQPNDPKGVALAVNTILSDESLRVSIVQNAKEMVASKYDWDIVAEDMKKVFI